MNAKPLNPINGEAAAWGAFYVRLHALAERIRNEKTAESASLDSSTESAATEQPQATHRGNYAPRRRAGQAEEAHSEQ